MRDVFPKVIFLLGIGTALALMVNGLSPNRIPLTGQWDARQGVVTADKATAALWMDFEIPDPAAAKRIFDAGDALFVDVRSPEVFAEGHIPGAVSLPLGDLDVRLDTFTTEVPAEQPIVTYCSGRLCQDSHSAAQRLMERGFQNVVVFIDGFPGWMESGYPVAKQ